MLIKLSSVFPTLAIKSIILIYCFRFKSTETIYSPNSTWIAKRLAPESRFRLENFHLHDLQQTPFVSSLILNHIVE